jgi:transposase
MAKRLVNVDRDTPLLLPPSIQEWIPRDDMSRFIVDAVGLLEERHFGYNWRGSGSEQYPPRMMLALLIYCYANRLFSSRRIERATYRDIAVRYITADTHPDHDTIATFRRENGALIKSCFIEVLALAREMKVVKVGDVATDGSKLEANASKRRVKTKQELQHELQAVEARVEALLKQAEQTDQSEDGAADGSRLPEALGDAVARRDKLEAALARLDANRLRDSRKRDKERAGFDHDGPGDPPRVIEPASVPDDRINLTDSDAKLLPGKKGGYHPAYNTQIAVQADLAAPLILAGDVSDESSDRRQLAPMVEQVINHHPQTQRVLVDTGYDNAAQIHQVEKNHGVIIYCPPEETERKAKPEARETKARRRTKEFREGMRACMRGEFGRSSQTLRATTVEPVFSWIKTTLGFRRFQLRGMAKVRLEWDLVCLVHNLSLLHRVTQSRKSAIPA